MNNWIFVAFVMIAIFAIPPNIGIMTVQFAYSMIVNPAEIEAAAEAHASELNALILLALPMIAFGLWYVFGNDEAKKSKGFLA